MSALPTASSHRSSSFHSMSTTSSPNASASDGEAPATTVSWEELKEAGNDAFKKNLLDTAVERYSSAIALNPAEAVLFGNRSAAYLKKGDMQKALKDARTAITLDATYAKGYLRLHTALCNLGKFGEAAEEVAAGAIRLRASSVHTNKDVENLQRLADEARNAQRAMSTSTQLIADKGEDAYPAVRMSMLPITQQFPDCAPAAFLLAEASASSNPERVTQSLAAFSYTHSSDPYYLYIRALAMYYSGSGSKAQLILRQALEFDPDFKKAQTLIRKIRQVETQREEGNQAFKAKKFDEANKAYTAAIDADPHNKRVVALLRGNRAAALMELKDYAAALKDCDYAIDNGNDGAKIYARRSRISESLEKYDDAVRDLQHAAEVDRSYGTELHQLKIRAKRAKRKDYYKILDLDQRSADENSIKRAYKKACLQWHPDKWAHASEEEQTVAESKFKDVGEAFSVLSDPRKKNMYDNGQLDNDVEGAGGMGGMGGGFPGGPDGFVNIFQMFGQGGGFGNPRGARGHPGGGPFQYGQNGTYFTFSSN